MKLNDIETRIVPWFRSQQCIYLRGPVGRGKTTTIERAPALISKALGGNYGFVCISGPLLNPPDAVGYLMPEKRSEWLMSVFTQPFWFITSEGKHLSEYDGGIILVDEADKMDTDVKKVIGEAALSGRLGPHDIKKWGKWIVWMAGNRASDRSGSTKEFDHLINRRREINVDDDLQSVLDFFNKNDALPAFTAFAANNAQCVFEEPPPVPGPWCTPRSLFMLSDYAKTLIPEGSEKVPMDGLFREEAAGSIGEGAAAQLFATLELQEIMPSFDDIVRNPKKAPLPTAPDAQMMVAYTLAAKVDDKTFGPCIEYVERMPAEFTITFGKASTQRNIKLITTPAFSAWTSRNAALMMAITAAM